MRSSSFIYGTSCTRIHEGLEETEEEGEERKMNPPHQFRVVSGRAELRMEDGACGASLECTRLRWAPPHRNEPKPTGNEMVSCAVSELEAETTADVDRVLEVGPRPGSDTATFATLRPYRCINN